MLGQQNAARLVLCQAPPFEDQTKHTNGKGLTCDEGAVESKLGLLVLNGWRSRRFIRLNRVPRAKARKPTVTAQSVDDGHELRPLLITIGHRKAQGVDDENQQRRLPVPLKGHVWGNLDHENRQFQIQKPAEF